MKRCFIMILCCAMLLAGTAYAAPQEPDTSRAEAAILYEATTGTIIYADEPDKEIIPASMTKIMTAILAIEKNPTLEGMLTVKQEVIDATYAVNPDLCLLGGEKVAIRDVMDFMLICSDNEAANTMADYVAGSLEAFPDMMNAKAQEIGCEDTHFLDAQGVSTYGHYTTCSDVVKMLQYAMQYDIFREIVGTVQNVLPPSNVRVRGPLYETTNRVLFPKDLPLYQNDHSEYMVGGKSGSLHGVGSSFAGLTIRDGMELYTVVAQGGEQIVDGETYKDCYLLTIDLLDYATNFAVTSVSCENEVARVPMAGGGSIGVRGAEPCGFLYEKGSGEGTVTLDLPAEVPADTKAGDVVGKAVLKYGGEEKTVDLVAMSETEGTAPTPPAQGTAGTDTDSGSIAPALIGGGAALVAAAAAVMAAMKKKGKKVQAD